MNVLVISVAAGWVISFLAVVALCLLGLVSLG
jgi:hypothetical protein